MPCTVKYCGICNEETHPGKCGKCFSASYTLNADLTECTCALANCETCSDTPGECLSCDAGFGVNAAKTCEACAVSDCAECATDKTTCIKCDAGFFKVDDTTCTACTGTVTNC